MKSLRDMYMTAAPRMLRGYNGQGLIWALAVIQDATLAWSLEALLAKYPSFASEESMALIAENRRLFRGFAEPKAAFALRAIGWLDAHRRRGHCFALLEALAGYLAPFKVPMHVVNDSGLWYSRDGDGVESWHRADPTNFDWDGRKSKRTWVILYPPPELWTAGPPLGDPALWGGAVGSTAHTIGSTATPQQVADVRQIVRAISARHSQVEYVIVCFDQSFDPQSPPGAPMPDGTWGFWSLVGDPPTPARNVACCYWPIWKDFE